jgi:hypothetical protein
MKKIIIVLLLIISKMSCNQLYAIPYCPATWYFDVSSQFNGEETGAIGQLVDFNIKPLSFGFEVKFGRIFDNRRGSILGVFGVAPFDIHLMHLGLNGEIYFPIKLGINFGCGLGIDNLLIDKKEKILKIGATPYIRFGVLYHFTKKIEYSIRLDLFFDYYPGFGYRFDLEDITNNEPAGWDNNFTRAWRIGLGITIPIVGRGPTGETDVFGNSIWR